MSQLEKYEKLFPITLVVNIFLNESILIEKLAARRYNYIKNILFFVVKFLIYKLKRTCVGCGKSYNLVDIHRDGYDMYPLLPKVEGKCDKCGDKLITRPDDQEDVNF
jgi:hypothetical protein